MSAAPLVDSATPSNGRGRRARNGIEPGLIKFAKACVEGRSFEATIPRHVAAQITDARLTEDGRLEGLSARTGAWGDISALGAKGRAT